MKKKILSLLLAICLFATMLPVSAGASAAPDWSSAYKDFILSGDYLTAFDYEQVNRAPAGGWGNMSEKSAALYDMDQDGTPELFIYNGDISQICCIDYIYTFYEGGIKLLGSCGANPRYFPNTSYPGICSAFQSSGAGSRSYVTKSGLDLPSEVVYSYDNSAGGDIEKRTEDDTLFHLFLNGGGEPILHTALSQIELGGWDAFGKDFLPDSPAVPPSFTDIPTDAFYATPVAWAVENEITSGVGSGKFNPMGTCTRGQIVTFLWRAAGEPEPSSTYNPFTDVKPSDYFYKAVLWAVEKKVTSGTGNTSFSPESPCTRGEAVTFLWRAEGQPAHSLAYSPFKDVPANAFYRDPILWAASNGIAAGTAARAYSPEVACNRGQIVTFLYRLYVEPISITLPEPEKEIYRQITSGLPSKVKTMMYDVNNDGTDELFVYYGEDCGGNAIKTSIYTIQNNTVVPVMEDEILQSIASVPAGGVGVVEKQGKRYVYTCGRNAGYTHPYTGRFGTIRLYTFDGARLTLAEEIEYQLRVKGSASTPTESKITHNEISISYSTYQAWVDSLNWMASLGDVRGVVNAYF